MYQIGVKQCASAINHLQKEERRITLDYYASICYHI